MPYPFAAHSALFDADHFERRLRLLAHRPPFEFPAGAIPEDFHQSSVLIAFWRDPEPEAAGALGDLRVLLTKRAETLSGHPGQMSFPGGRLEPGETWAEGALRETEEEVGIARTSVEVLGRLDDAWSGAGHHLVPVVGWLDAPPCCEPNPAEVSAVHTPSISALMTPSAYFEEERSVGDRTFVNPILRWPEDELFGLSTDLLIEALLWAAARDEPPERSPGQSRLDSLQGFLRLKASGAFAREDKEEPRRKEKSGSET